MYPCLHDPGLALFLADPEETSRDPSGLYPAMVVGVGALCLSLANLAMIALT